MSEVSLFETMFESEISKIVSFLDNWFVKKETESHGLSQLNSSITYSMFSSGKRFRPLLSLLTAKALGEEEETVLAFACATELIHTYSLIHDDLPLMDNDDFRRGQPTNHKVYGEAMALLAGDALLTEAFRMISESYTQKPQLGLKAVSLLAKASGRDGMVGGQAIDIKALEGHKTSIEELKTMHAMKTGALIAVSVEGAALLSGATTEEQTRLREFGELLGLAFQLSDDVLDHQEGEEELSGFPLVMGVEETKAYLQEVTKKALESLEGFGDSAEALKKVVEFNINRIDF